MKTCRITYRRGTGHLVSTIANIDIGKNFDQLLAHEFKLSKFQDKAWKNKMKKSIRHHFP